MCKKCFKIFNYSSQLIKHRNRKKSCIIHNNKEFSCDKCFKEFQYLSHLRQHQNRKNPCGMVKKNHTICNICFAEFSSNQALQYHQNKKTKCFSTMDGKKCLDLINKQNIEKELLLYEIEKTKLERSKIELEKVKEERRTPQYIIYQLNINHNNHKDIYPFNGIPIRNRIWDSSDFLKVLNSINFEGETSLFDLTKTLFEIEFMNDNRKCNKNIISPSKEMIIYKDKDNWKLSKIDHILNSIMSVIEQTYTYHSNILDTFARQNPKYEKIVKCIQSMQEKIEKYDNKKYAILKALDNNDYYDYLIQKSQNSNIPIENEFMFEFQQVKILLDNFLKKQPKKS